MSTLNAERLLARLDLWAAEYDTVAARTDLAAVVTNQHKSPERILSETLAFVRSDAEGEAIKYAAELARWNLNNDGEAFAAVQHWALSHFDTSIGSGLADQLRFEGYREGVRRVLTLIRAFVDGQVK